MKLLLSIFFTLFIFSANAKFRKDIPAYLCMYGAGFSYGFSEALIWHNPYPKSTFLNPYLSWKKENKVWIKTDGYHIGRAAQYGFTTAAIVLSVNDFKKPKLIPIAKKILINSVFYYAGQMTSYKLIFK